MVYIVAKTQESGVLHSLQFNQFIWLVLGSMYPGIEELEYQIPIPKFVILLMDTNFHTCKFCWSMDMAFTIGGKPFWAIRNIQEL